MLISSVFENSFAAADTIGDYAVPEEIGRNMTHKENPYPQNTQLYGGNQISQANSSPPQDPVRVGKAGQNAGQHRIKIGRASCRERV